MSVFVKKYLCQVLTLAVVSKSRCFLHYSLSRSDEEFVGSKEIRNEIKFDAVSKTLASILVHTGKVLPY